MKKTINLNMISLILLFLFALNFINMESRIILVLAAWVIFVVGMNRFYLSINAIILFFFSIFFYFISAIYRNEYVTFYLVPFLLGPVLGYLTGYGMLTAEKGNEEKTFVRLLFAIILGRFAHGVLNIFVSNGFVDVERNGTDFWTRRILAATGQGALMTLAISLFFYAIFIVKKKDMMKKILLCAMVAVAIYNSIMSASRTALIIMLIVFVICFLYMLFSSGFTQKKKMILFFAVFFLVFAIVLIYSLNVFSIRTQIENSPLYIRLTSPEEYESGDENRYEMIVNAIRIGITHPFGDGTNDTAHNLWLDTFKQTGWLTFVLLLAFTIGVLVDLKRVLSHKRVPTELKYLCLSLFSAILINFAVEPIMKGMPYYFVVFCIMAGALHRYLVCITSEKVLINEQ